MSEFKRGDKVVFEKDGKELIGVIHAVGNTLAGVEVGDAYLALEIAKLTIATPARDTWQNYFDVDYAYVESQVAIPGVKVVVAPTPAPALDFSKWEKGDVVRATSDDSYDISVGHFYILTEDESRGWLKFRDDDNYPRTRHIENYELVLKRNK